MQRHFLLIPNPESVYHLGNDFSLAWSRHFHPYPPVTDAMSVPWPRPLPVLWFRAIWAFLLFWFYDSRIRAVRTWS